MPVERLGLSASSPSATRRMFFFVYAALLVSTVYAACTAPSQKHLKHGVSTFRPSPTTYWQRCGMSH